MEKRGVIEKGLTPPETKTQETKAASSTGSTSAPAERAASSDFADHITTRMAQEAAARLAGQG